MVNELQSQEWAYLLDPCFQLVNTNGKPLTNGHIEVFYHGTRTPYYCASDWNGTLHPFKIKIDSLGSNVVLADPNYSYDVYVYNAYGVLQMSRYNVNPGVGGSGGGSSSDGEAPHWNSDPNGGASSSVTGGTTVYLTLPSSEDQPDFVDHSTDTAIFLKEGLYHIDAVVSFKQDDDDLQNIIKDLVINTGLMGWDAQMTGQKNWTGPESTDDDRHFLELHTVVSVPEDSLQSLYFQIASPVDLDSAAIEKLDIVKLTAGGGGMTYAAGYGIDITGQVISTSGMMPESAAANFVDVSAYNTDIENIYETIAETSAMIPSGVATEQFVEDFTSAFITEDALNGYATEQWVEDQHFITSADIPPIPQDVVTSGELATVSGDIVSQIPSLDGYATQQWVGEQGYLTEIPSEYVTQTEMENYTSAFITSADIPDIPEDVVTSGELASTSAELESMIPSLDGYATEQFVEDYTSAFITSADVPHFTQEQADWDEDDPTAPDYIKNKPSIPSIEGLASEQYVQDYTSAFITSADIPDVPEDLVTSAELATVSGEIVNQIPDVSDMATQTWVNEQGYITSIPAEYATSGDLVTLSGAIEAEIPSYTAGDNISIVSDTISVSGTAGLIAGDNVTITASGDSYVISSTGGGDVPADVVTSGQLATVSGNIMNEIPDTSDMATKTWVGQQGYLTSVPEDLVTSGELATVSGDIMSQIPSPTTVSIDPSLSYGTKIAEFNINGTSGELYAPAGGGEITYPLVYESSNPEEDNIMTSAALIVDDGGIVKNIMTTSPYEIVISREIPSIHSIARTTIDYNGIHLENEYDDEYIYTNDVIAWNNTKNAVINSANKWNSAYNAINSSASYWNAAAGMNEYPISAGPGMSIEDVDGVTVFQTSGTMMDDLIEYNSQDEISGYNGHPVMTVDSEKQWLTHDDTIAHVTNSAQYAFGVNVPVVAQAMGTDETVLFETSAVNGAGICPLSESLKNFEQIKVLATRGYNGSSNPSTNGGTGPWSFWDTDGIKSDGADYHSVTPFIFEGYNWKNSCYSANNEYNLLTWYRGCQKNMTSAAAGTAASSFTDCVGIKKIVGIGRKEN